MPDRDGDRKRECLAVGIHQHRHDYGGQRQLRHPPPGEPAVGAGTGHPVPVTGACAMTAGAVRLHPGQRGQPGAFVQATILNTLSGQLSVYDPLVITQGTSPSSAPVVPTPPRGVRGLDRLRVQRYGPHSSRRHGERPSAGQLRQRQRFSVRPGVVLQRDQLIQHRVPARARGQAGGAFGGNLRQDRRFWRQSGTGETCPTTRNFDMVDQDQSDNVTTLYLLNPATGRPRRTPRLTRVTWPALSTLANGSDDILVDAIP